MRKIINNVVGVVTKLAWGRAGIATNAAQLQGASFIPTPSYVSEETNDSKSW